MTGKCEKKGFKRTTCKNQIGELPFGFLFANKIFFSVSFGGWVGLEDYCDTCNLLKFGVEILAVAYWVQPPGVDFCYYDDGRIRDYGDLFMVRENCLYLNSFVRQSKVRSLSYATIPFEVTGVNIY